MCDADLFCDGERVDGAEGTDDFDDEAADGDPLRRFENIEECCEEGGVVEVGLYDGSRVDYKVAERSERDKPLDGGSRV